jgi:hypothetical protein
MMMMNDECRSLAPYVEININLQHFKLVRMVFALTEILNRIYLVFGFITPRLEKFKTISILL